MTAFALTGAGRVAGVVGAPVRHSLSPLIHNAWIAAAGLDAAYAPFAVSPDRFEAFVAGLRGGAVAGLNVTAPFKPTALRLADRADPVARACGAANLLLFATDGSIEARNTDGAGLLHAFATQAPSWSPNAAAVGVLGAGGAARAAVEAMSQAGARVAVANRTHERAQGLAGDFAGVEAVTGARLQQVLSEATAVINATPAARDGVVAMELRLDALPASAIVMDMVYTPLRTPLLRAAQARGLATVDGLAMLIGQALPSFEAFFGRAAPADLDVRGMALAALGEGET